MINNQLGRRNLSPDVQSYLRGKQYDREKKKVSNEKGSNQFSEVKGNNCPQPTTAQRLATQHNVSERTIKDNATYSKGVDIIAGNTSNEIKHKILNRELVIGQKDMISFEPIFFH